MVFIKLPKDFWVFIYFGTQRHMLRRSAIHFQKDLFLCMHMFVCVCVYVYMFIRRPEEGVGFLGAAVFKIMQQVCSHCTVFPAHKSITSPGYCELVDLGSGSRTLVLCKNSKCSCWGGSPTSQLHVLKAEGLMFFKLC